MKRRYADYNRMAHIYDRLAKLVFGDNIVQSQKYLIKHIPERASILIIGGGTGWILEDIARIYPSGLSITYVDRSEKMIAMAITRNYKDNRVDFICKPIQQVLLKNEYQIIITPFLFDNFSNKTVQLIFNKLNPFLSKNGQWLFTDFVYQKDDLYSRILLKLMYAFFGAICHLETSELPDCDKIFSLNQYDIKKEKLFWGGFIKSIIYIKRIAA